MHLLATRPGGYAAGDGVVDLRQTPADVVLLSAADTDLSLLASAAEALPSDFPTLRLASLLALRSNASVDLYADTVLRHARVVIVALIGGSGYWPYGVDRLVEFARDGVLELVLVPGDDTFDPELERLSSVSPGDGRAIWRYLREGGPHNARALLELIGQRFFGRAEAPAPLRELERVVVYDAERGSGTLELWRRRWPPDAPVAALLFYRAHLQAGNLRAFDALLATLERQGLAPLPIALASLKDPGCRAEVEALLVAAGAAIVLNTTGFALAAQAELGPDAGALGLDRPVLQVMVSGGTVEDWRSGATGLSPRDLAMSVVLPELDGRIITRAVSFKGVARRSERAELDAAEYQLEPERAAFVAELAARWVELGRTPPRERRVALVLANYPARDGRVGNGVGLDTPASSIEILRALAANGYAVTEVPEDGDALIRALLAGVTNELGPIDTRRARQSLPRAEYERVWSSLPAGLRDAVERRWGGIEQDPRYRDGHFVISGLVLGGTFVGVQPARGYEIDPASTYHDPELVPPHGYLAFYFWLRYAYRAHAVVHVGKHGNLEWLPGKSVALGPSCWPDAVFGPWPHLYPFIVNDPGEGTQAKRRSQAVIIDHLVPPLTRAESYGPLRDLEKLVDEYYQATALDPPRAELLRRQILKLARDTHLSRELGFDDARLSSAEDERLLVRVDAYLCELKESQIRDGLHVFGRSPLGAQRTDTLVALARLPARRGAGRDQSLIVALARALLEPAEGPAFDPLDAEFSAPWRGPRPALLAELTPDPWRTAGDTRERLELLAQAIVAGELEPPAACREVAERVRAELGPLLDRCGAAELAGLLAGLDGRYVTPGPSGAPTRGRLDVLPTGRNFYSIDVRAVPTPAAVELARRAADRLVQRYVQDHGEYPAKVALSVWGTATMRTGGDDMAQVLALLGVRPVWADGSGRVIDTEILPLSVLRRPRVDVLLRISGFFRDAFPDLIRLFDSAVRSVAALDEPDEQNPVRARVRAAEQALLSSGLEPAEAARRARYRVFGSRPGAYGAGLQTLIDSGRWRDRQDLAEVFLAWSGYAYTGEDGDDGFGVPARQQLEVQLKGVDAVLHNQDNREHDVLDSGDYYEFLGGLSASVELVRGAPVALYHGDNANPAAPRVRAFSEEIARVMRSRVVNPKWIAAARRHGYKGASEMAATVEYVFGFAASAGLVQDYQFALLSDAYLLDEQSRRFLAEHNPSALREMSERLLEAMQRGLWRDPGAYREALEAVLLDAEEGPG